jgi:hypothetical protein
VEQKLSVKFFSQVLLFSPGQSEPLRLVCRSLS